MLAMNKRGLKGADSPSWKGESVSYAGVHKWISNNWGKADHCENRECLQESNTYHWSNKSGEYHRERDDWHQLCTQCHRFFDTGKPKRKGYVPYNYTPKPYKKRERIVDTITHCRKGHEYTQLNTRWGKREGYDIRICRTCAYNQGIKDRLKRKERILNGEII